MIKFTTLSKKLKSDVEYIDNVMFGGYEGNQCYCLVTFKYLGKKTCGWSYQLVNHINYYIENCDARLSASCSTSENLVIKFKVQLS